MTLATIWRKNSFLLPGSKLVQTRGTERALCELRSQVTGFTEQVTAHLGGSTSKLGQLFHPRSPGQCQSSAFSLWRKDRFQLAGAPGDLVTSLPLLELKVAFWSCPFGWLQTEMTAFPTCLQAFFPKVIRKGQWG